MITLGFIVHIESALNLDIDFGIDEKYWKRYRLDRAINNSYSYFQEDNESAGDFYVGSVHRVRLHGIVLCKDSLKKNRRLINMAVNEFKQKVDRSGGFVKYEISGVDVYGRVIARLTDPITDECLNDIFLQPKYEAVFKRYTR